MNRILPSALLCCLLSACGSAKDANNTNFTKALNTHFASHCMLLETSDITDSNFPLTIPLQVPSQFVPVANAKLQNDKATAQYEALVQIGWLSEAKGTTTVQNFFGPPATVPAKIYSLTAAGKAAATARPFFSTGPAFCIGHYTVDSIIRFTPPENGPGGSTSEVVFTYGPSSDVPSWAYSSAVQSAFPNLANTLRKSQQGDVTLVLTNNGWMDSDDFSN
jgi:hypothetical protein